MIDSLFCTENCSHECLADIDTVLCLTEVVGIGGAVNIGSDFVDAWEGMQNTHVGFAAFEHRGSEDAAVFHPFVLEWVGETFTLNTGHVDDVCIGDDAAEVGVLVVFKACFFDAHLDR